MCKICFHKKQISYAKIYEIFFNTKKILKKNLILTFSSKGDDFAGRDFRTLRFKKGFSISNFLYDFMVSNSKKND
jgi:hypothetical protein